MSVLVKQKPHWAKLISHLLYNTSQRFMHMVFVLLCFVLVSLWSIYPYLTGFLHWGNHAPVKKPCKIWVNDSDSTLKYMGKCVMWIHLKLTWPQQNTTQENMLHISWYINTLRPRQICHHFTDNIFKCIFLNENVWISFEFIPKFRINNIPHWFRCKAIIWTNDG